MITTRQPHVAIHLSTFPTIYETEVFRAVALLSQGSPANPPEKAPSIQQTPGIYPVITTKLHVQKGTCREKKELRKQYLSGNTKRSSTGTCARNDVK